ncbi:2-phospho-L-lactate transferase [Bradyrhizobium sp. CCBAU 21359]|uniref:2-phospho-L-lactate transferase n=1 Tax=Bradyrhizobium sp. CCBAU 21359 TaxID=1325080 RepID=UPI0023055CBF|nr:2-phospho-L-lactate transferase [Bradyrhizobium sp. CCBAU 21359]MDA9459568.1 2-phospho-L-lactate transferase [Bradyrhizobium sp. CCBAU 21359]
MNGRSQSLPGEGRVVALCGGVGGAKLAIGLQHVLGERLTVVVNVADDFEHLGLHISPDLDTVLYTLAGLSDPGRGWGRSDETWNFMQALKQIGGETWFLLGDGDMAMHVERTRRRSSGESLTAITSDIARRLGVRPAVLPVTNDKLSTMVDSSEGELEFQRYFVGRRCEPVVKQIRFNGAQNARLSEEVLASLDAEDLRLIILCPSNPYLSIDPILAVPGMAEKLRATSVPVVAISPIIGGQAIKGPTRKIMDELGLEPSNAEIARHYGGLLDGLVIDAADAAGSADLGVDVHPAPTLMTDLQSKITLAKHALAFGESLRAKHERLSRPSSKGGAS